MKEWRTEGKGEVRCPSCGSVILKPDLLDSMPEELPEGITYTAKCPICKKMAKVAESLRKDLESVLKEVQITVMEEEVMNLHWVIDEEAH